jgi:hypothetical protein
MKHKWFPIKKKRKKERKEKIDLRTEFCHIEHMDIIKSMIDWNNKELDTANRIFVFSFIFQANDQKVLYWKNNSRKYAYDIRVFGLD